MRLYFKQRFFSWLDSYDIYDEEDRAVFTVEGKLSWGHCLHIQDAAGNHIATLQEKVLSFLPRFELYIGEQYVGCIEEVAHKEGWISTQQLHKLGNELSMTAYGQHLLSL